MAIFPFKLLVFIIQRRSLQTKASNIVPALPKQAQKSSKGEANAGKSLPLLAQNAETVKTLLRNHHFSETQIANLIARYPRILTNRVNTNLLPKLRFFSENGFNGSLLPALILSNPLILKRSLYGHLKPSLEILKAQLVMCNDKDLKTVLKRASWLLTLDLGKHLIPNMRFLEKEGMPMSNILKLFTQQPRALIGPLDRKVSGIEMVKKFGIMPNDPMFPHAFRVVAGWKESSFKMKVEAFKRLGWSDEDIVSTFVRQPICLTQSEEKVRRNMEFLVKTMKMEPQAVIDSPKLVMYSLENRIIPRCKVLKALEENNLLSGQKKVKVLTAVNMMEEEFIRRYIKKYVDQIPHLWKVYHGNSKMDGAVKQ